MGQRTVKAPVNGTVDVWVSVMLDRILDVDERSYRHGQVMYVSLTWEDPRFYGIVGNTSRDTCIKRCVTGGRACCDQPWLPGVDILNVFELPEGRIVRHGLIASKDNPVVTWWHLIHGVFFSTMNFRAFPFDYQELQIEFASQFGWNLSFIPSETGELGDGGVVGDDVSGWSFNGIDITSWNDWELGRVNPLKSQTKFQGSSTDPRYLYEGAFTNVHGHETSGFDVVIIIQRNAWFYVFSVLIPIVLTVMMTITVFWMDPSSVGERVSVVITLFLALTALQFVINDKLPDSSYFTGVTILILESNVMLFFALVESMLVYYLAKGTIKLTLDSTKHEETQNSHKSVPDRVSSVRIHTNGLSASTTTTDESGQSDTGMTLSEETSSAADDIMESLQRQDHSVTELHKSTDYTAPKRPQTLAYVEVEEDSIKNTILCVDIKTLNDSHRCNATSGRDVDTDDHTASSLRSKGTNQSECRNTGSSRTLMRSWRNFQHFTETKPTSAYFLAQRIDRMSLIFLIVFYPLFTLMLFMIKTR
eukprot:CFRG7252T1